MIASSSSGTGSTISSLAYYPNNLHPDDDERAKPRTLTCARWSTRRRRSASARSARSSGTTRTARCPENLERFRQIWPPLVAYAGERGVQIAIENCPMIFSYDEWPGGNNLACHAR